jgi:hypothetical protein
MLRTRNKKLATGGSCQNTLLLPSLGAGLLLLLSAQLGPAARSEAAAFQPYKDAKAGFQLSKPEGWQVRTQALNIWVESPDKSELVLTRAFTPKPGQTAADWLQTLGTQYDTDFPQSALDHAQHIQTNGDEIIADGHYQAKGEEKMRLLCRIVNGKGLAYVFAAPADRYLAEQPKMLHVAQSIAFFAPRSTAKSNGSGGSAAFSAAQMKATAGSIHWTTWQDPREHAFSVSVPQGWTTEGGTFREASGSVNFFFTTLSPNKDTFVLVGNPTFLTFTQPSQMSRSFGWEEGTHGVLHYMRSPEFNDMYLNKVGSTLYDNVTIGKGQELEKLSEQLTQQANQVYGGAATVSYGVTAFKCTVKATGMACNGMILSTTTRTVSPAAGEPVVGWYADLDLIVTKAGDTKAATRIETATAIFGHLMQTFRTDPTWEAKREQQSRDQISAQGRETLANIAAVGERSRQIAANSSAALDAIMGRNNSHVAAGNEQQSAFINYIGDRTNVSDDNGHTDNVGSGYNNYYRNDRTGTILGTDSAYSPGVDFTPMKEY